jgi:dihydrofolate reductase
MRKLKLQLQVSLDGFAAAGPHDDQRWVTWAWDEIRGEVLELIDGADTIVLGRTLAQGFIPHWVAEAADREAPMHELAQRVAGATKLVFTATLDASPWPNTVLARGDVGTEIDALKRRTGKDIMVYGGTSFVTALIARGLIDEYHLFVNPVVLGRGVQVFGGVNGWRQLELIRSVPYECGIVLLTYEPR